jgi:hypothetical protein
MIRGAVFALVIAAVPSSCIPEQPHFGDLVVHNRTSQVIMISNEESEIGTVGACESAEFSAITLNHVRVSQAGRVAAELTAPADDSIPHVLVVSRLGAELRTATPDPMPGCSGLMP